MSDCNEMEMELDFAAGKKDCVRCRKPGHPLPKPILFECGNGNGFSYRAGTSIEKSHICMCQERTVGNVTIDTTCLCKPKTQINFTCNCAYDHGNKPSVTAECHLDFTLYKCVDNGCETPIGTWQYRVRTNEHLTETFTFFTCDCSSCSGCTNYTVRVRPVDVEDCTICVNSCHISAMAIAGCD
jgi:hypothetical protein